MGTDGMTVIRTLPNRERRMVGPWCFVDHFGAAAVEATPGNPVDRGWWRYAGPAAPAHRAADGDLAARGRGRAPRQPRLTTQLIRPGQLNLMTAGRGIAHAEVSPAAGRALHGRAAVGRAARRDTAPSSRTSSTTPRLPVLPSSGAASVTVLMGALGGVASPARTYTPAGRRPDRARRRHRPTLPLGARTSSTPSLAPRPARPTVDGAALCRAGRCSTSAAAPRPRPGADAGQLLLLGGEPFAEEIVMWWNFIGRSHDEIVADREDWMAGRRFGPVRGFDGAPLPAPELPTTPLKPRGRLR